MPSGKGMSGWLAPSGVFYPCGHQEHHELAEKVVMDNKEMNKERIRIGFEKGTVIYPDDALKFMDWIVMGHAPWGESDNDYIFFPTHDITWQRTQEQINWFEENYHRLTPKQQEMLEEHIESIL